MTEVRVNSSQRREETVDSIVLGLLDFVERDPAMTQRRVASELGIALGLANAYLKRCVRKGLIKVRQVPRQRYTYYLTPNGFAEKSRLTATYLSDSFSFFRTARTQCAELFKAAAARGQRKIVLLGAGDLAEIARLVAYEQNADIAGVVEVIPGSLRLAEDVAALGGVDAIMITTLAAAREVYDAAIPIFGADHVYAPGLLRILPLGRNVGTNIEGQP